ncbi:hypothetical protein HDV04_004515 [Boothiomyces sp. JEL0838]|nr:hypothetical protein HDV04_004515 [Boothiomyces sp. JEL0838]
MLFNLILSVTNAAKISDIVANTPNLSKVAGAIQSNPEWSANGSFTLFAPIDNANNLGSLPNGDLGYVFVKSAVTPSQYQILDDVSGKKTVVMQNLNIRYGLNSGDLKQVTADNGYVYISQIGLGPPGSPSDTLKWLGCNQLLKALDTAGMTNFVNGLNGYTFFAPTDDAINGASNTLSKLSTSQLQAVLAYHMLPQTMRSTQVSSGNMNTLLSGSVLPIKATSTGVFVGTGHPDTGIFSMADNFATGGVIHRVDYVLIPPTIPDVVNITGFASSAQSTTTSTVTTSMYTTIDFPRNTKSEADQFYPFAVSIVGLAIGILFY